MKNIKFRLIVMNFLQYAVWGSWLISLGTYLGKTLHFDGAQIGSFYATMGIASLFMPAVMGVIADRWVQAQRLLGVSHIVAALLSVMFYMPTIALSNTVAYTALNKANLDTVKAFPPIRIWGTIGFICAMWAVDLTGWKDVAFQLNFSAILGIVLGLYSLTLPACDINRNVKANSWIDTLGLRAFALFKEKKMAGFGNVEVYGEQYLNTFGVKHSTMLISLSQISETLCILLIPFCLKRFGIKNVMLISMFAWVLRFGLLGAGNPGTGVW